MSRVDVSKLPDHIKKQLAKKYPEIREHLGVFESDRKSAVDLHNRDRKEPSMNFGSKGERSTYIRIRGENPAVFVHPKIVLTWGPPSKTFTPDYCVCRVVNTTDQPMQVELQPGEFVGYMADYKATWGKGTKKAKVHIERDWDVRRAWLKDMTGIEVKIITDGVIKHGKD